MKEKHGRGLAQPWRCWTYSVMWTIKNAEVLLFNPWDAVYEGS